MITDPETGRPLLPHEIRSLAAAHLEAERQADLRREFLAQLQERPRDQAYLARVYRQKGLLDTTAHQFSGSAIKPRPAANTQPTDVYQPIIDRKDTKMSRLNLSTPELAAILRQFGLDGRDPKVADMLMKEYQYFSTKAAREGDSALARGQISHIVERAAERTAERLGVRQPMSRTQADTRDPRQRWLDSLSPEQRAHAEKWATEKESPAEQTRQQAALRQEFLNEVNARAVCYDRGNALDDKSAAYLRQKYAKLGLQDTSISRSEIGQTDEALFRNLGEKPAVRSGAYQPVFRFAGDGSVEAADRPNDTREQGHRASWLGSTNGGSGK